jgi:hypothetical protein
MDPQDPVASEGRVPQVPQGERRAHPHILCGKGTVIYLAERPHFSSVRSLVRDVSRGGIAFFFNRSLEPGTVLALQLRGRLPGTSCIRSAKVIHATKGLGCWVIGCQVSPPFSDEEIESLL